LKAIHQVDLKLNINTKEVRTIVFIKFKEEVLFNKLSILLKKEDSIQDLQNSFQVS